MIDKATAIPVIINKLKKLPLGHAIDLRTYKRNRSVVIARTGDDEFDVVENGFHEERFLLPMSKMKKLLKILMKREFPRSTKIRCYDIGESEADIHMEREKDMIDKSGAVPNILTRLKKIAIGHGLELRTYKRDRGVSILRIGDDAYEIEEDGFEKQHFETDHKGLKKLLKTLLKREFPRSNKIRLADFGPK